MGHRMDSAIGAKNAEQLALDLATLEAFVQAHLCSSTLEAKNRFKIVNRLPLWAWRLVWSGSSQGFKPLRNV